MNNVLDDLFSLKSARRFKEDVTMAIINNRAVLTWAHVLQIAETRSISQSQIHKTFKELLREVLAGRNISLAKERDLIETFIAKMKVTEPFQGLPNEVRIHLERLREALEEQPEKLEPLTAQIRELVAINNKEKRIQKYLTMAGFVIGIIGLGFAAYSYLYPPAAG
jgi:hypothetical protein